MRKTALIIGAGPAGLTAAFELLERTDILPIVIEKSEFMGGISRTVNYKGNRMDIGGHRFFSKSDRVMNWWLRFMPLESGANAETEIAYQNQRRSIMGSRSRSASPDEVMLVRPRKSRIYFLRKFFDYPISLSRDTIAKLGLWRVAKIAMSYLKACVAPIRNERNLEQFFINRFGRELYHTFFKSYTEKVWGVPCEEISAEWGAQRIKGLSITKSLKHALGKLLPKRKGDLAQKNTETSLIERFLYPKLGPGQMWEAVAREVVARGGKIVTHAEARKLHVGEGRITHVTVCDTRTGTETVYSADYAYSTMPVKELVERLDVPASSNVREVAAGLMYRDFITVGLLVDKLTIAGERGKRLIEDNWIYIQEPDVMVGRLQIFNNWSPALVADPSKVWLGMEYFCYESDPIWSKPDQEMIEFAATELEKIGIIDSSEVRDATVIRVPKTYPAYFGAYSRFEEIREFLDGYENLFLIGRNGMHKYNNQDHSMLTAMLSVDNIVAGRVDKSNLWDVNTEQDYHEKGSESTGSVSCERAQRRAEVQRQERVAA
jgi:protoporphyrinogen oxidase